MKLVHKLPQSPYTIYSCCSYYSGLYAEYIGHRVSYLHKIGFKYSLKHVRVECHKYFPAFHESRKTIKCQVTPELSQLKIAANNAKPNSSTCFCLRYNRCEKVISIAYLTKCLNNLVFIFSLLLHSPSFHYTLQQQVEEQDAEVQNLHFTLLILISCFQINIRGSGRTFDTLQLQAPLICARNPYARH